MDLTNIKPCVECAIRDKCRQRCSDGKVPCSLLRIHCILVYGEDCFKEVENGNTKE